MSGLIGVVLSIATLSAAHAASEEAEAARAQTPAPGASLVWRALLPHEARVEGPTSGRFVTSANGVETPFESSQPVPGFSGLVALGGDRFLALPDNGYGSKANSPDYVIGLAEIALGAAPEAGAPRPIDVVRYIRFSDPDGLLRDGIGVDFPITADLDAYPGSDDPVDPRIIEGRWLTGADFDVESIAAAADGTYWIGEEFGPYVFQVSADGVLISQPIAAPDLASPAHPEVLAGLRPATLGGSRGYEALAFGPDGLLLAVTEAAPTDPALRVDADDERLVRIVEIDPEAGAYTGRSWIYRKDGAAADNRIVIGDMAALGGTCLALIERDFLFGPDAALKRLYVIDLAATGPDGVVDKRLALDFLAIPDPDAVGGMGPSFALPFDSIEVATQISETEFVFAVDTNFPGQAARTPGEPDDTEMVQVAFDRPLTDAAPGDCGR